MTSRIDIIGQNGGDGEHYGPGGRVSMMQATVEEEEEWLRKEVLAGEKQAKKGKYLREIKPGVWVDVYDVLQAWGVSNPALQHMIKKALQPGQRGHKTEAQDMAEVVASALRAQELASAGA